MSSTTVRRVYLAPPIAQRSRKKSPGLKGSGDFVRDHRMELAPFIFAWFYSVAVTVCARVALAPLAYIAVSAVASAVIFQYGYKIRTLRQFTAKPKPGKDRSRRQRIRLGYVLGAPFVGAVWGTWSTMPNSRTPEWHPPSLWAYVVLIMMTFAVSVPWLYALRERRKVILYLDGLDREDEIMAIRDAKTLINDWIGWCSAASLSGSRLLSLRFNRWARCIELETRRGYSTLNFTANRLHKIEVASPWDIAPGMTRVDRSKTNARHLTVRYMLEDPHAGTLDPPAFDEMDDEDIIIGLFENAGAVLFELLNTCIAGESGAGKSALMNSIIRALARLKHIAILGVDLKPGSPEFTPWEDVMAALAKTNSRAEEMFRLILEGLDVRGELMTARKWKTWRPTEKEPFIVLIIDETQRLSKAAMKDLIDIAGIIRALGGIVIAATQYPVDANLPMLLKNNMRQRIGLRTSGNVADRVIFNDDQVRAGFKPSTLPLSRPGSFMISNQQYTMPDIARGWYSDETRVVREAEFLAKFRTLIDWGAPVDGSTRGELVDPSDYLEIVVSSVEDQILDALRLGHVTPKTISEFTEVPLRTVKLKLKTMKAEGLVDQDGERKPWRIRVE